MITDNQLEVLKQHIVKGKKFENEKERNRFNKTLVRIQKHIDKNLEKQLWLAINCPNILLDEERELEDESLEPHRRLKMFMKTMSNLNPRFEVMLVIKENYTKHR